MNDRTMSLAQRIGRRRVSIPVAILVGSAVGLGVGALLVTVSFLLTYVIPYPYLFGCPE